MKKWLYNTSRVIYSETQVGKPLPESYAALLSEILKYWQIANITFENKILKLVCADETIKVTDKTISITARSTDSTCGYGNDIEIDIKNINDNTIKELFQIVSMRHFINLASYDQLVSLKDVVLREIESL